jgi:ribonuclease Z
MKFSFTPLGCASALPTVNRFPSAHVLNVHERLFLIDCGEGCQMQIRKAGFSFLKISEIFISHIHGDHLFGIYGLLSTMSLLGRNSQIDIFAPGAFAGVLKSFMEHFGASINFKVNHIVIKCSEPKLIFETRKIEVLAFPLNHRIECYGFLFREKMPMRNVHKYKIESDSLTLYEIARLKEGMDVVRENGDMLINSEFTYQPFIPRSFAYCCDTAPFDKLPEYVKGVDILYHEATFANDLKVMAKETYHSTATDAAQCALNAGAKRLLMGHFSSRYKDYITILHEAGAVFNNSEAAEAGKEYEVDLVKPESA